MSEPEKKEPTLEEAVLALNEINLLCTKMEGYLKDDKLTDVRKLNRSEIIHHQIREIVEKWA